MKMFDQLYTCTCTANIAICSIKYEISMKIICLCYLFLLMCISSYCCGLHIPCNGIIQGSSHNITELQISCVFAFFALWKRVKTHVLSDQSVHITHTYCCVSNFPNWERTCTVVYITIHFCLWEIPRNYFPLYFSKERAHTSEGYQMFAFLSIDVKRNLIGCLR
jgi:hypothetical protein